MKKLYFIRHGQSVMNAEELWAGQIETPLTDLGREQAKIAGQAAKGLGIDLIVASPLSRALETAQIVAREIGYHPSKIETSSLLFERSFGRMEGKPHGKKFSYDIGEHESESDVELIQRAYLALEWINSFEADHILVVSHGSFGRALRSILKEEYPMSHPEKINNAELVCWVEE